MSNPLEKEYQYFLDIWPQLAKDYEGKFVAIKNKEVLGIYSEYLEAAKAVYMEHEKGTVLMQEIGKGPGSTTAFIYSPGIVIAK